MESYNTYRVFYEFDEDDYEYCAQIVATSEQTAIQRVKSSDPDVHIIRVEVL